MENKKRISIAKGSLKNNCTKSEAFKHFGFIEVGTKSICGNRYSKCLYNEKLNIYAVPFMWRTSFYRFISRDKHLKQIIDSISINMWYGIDVIKGFQILVKKINKQTIHGK